MIDTNELVLRLFISMFAGIMIGFTRKKYPAGVRTFTLICVGATMFTIISISYNLYGNPTEFDPSRTIAQIVTGIGFIGAGVIWKSPTKLSGLTTAAAIWATSALGILIGLGDFTLAAVSFIIIVAVLYSKRYFPDI